MRTVPIAQHRSHEFLVYTDVQSCQFAQFCLCEEVSGLALIRRSSSLLMLLQTVA